MTANQCLSKVFVDLETTGFDPIRNSVIACSIIRLNGDSVEQKTFYGRPESVHQWSDKAEAIHKISLWDAMKFPTHTQMAADILDFLLPSEFYYHGLRKFDWIRLEGLFFKTGQVVQFRQKCRIENVHSTLDLAKEKLQLPNYKLNTVCDYLDIELLHHKADSDARAVYLIWKKLTE